MGYTLSPRGSEGVSLDEGSGLETGYQEYEGNLEEQGTSLVPDNSVRSLDYVVEVGSVCERELGSTAALAVDEAIQVEGTGLSMRRTQENEVGGDRDMEPYLQLSHESQGLLSARVTAQMITCLPAHHHLSEARLSKNLALVAAKCFLYEPTIGSVSGDIRVLKTRFIARVTRSTDR